MPPELTDDMFAALVQNKLQHKSSPEASGKSDIIPERVQEPAPEVVLAQQPEEGVSDGEPPVSDMGISDEEEHTEREPARAAVEAVTPPPVVKDSSSRVASKGNSKRKPTRRLAEAPEPESENQKPKYVSVNRQAVLKAKSLMSSLTTDSDVVNACLYLVLGGEDMPQHIKDAAQVLKEHLGANDPSVMLGEMQKFNHQMMLLERRNERLLREMQLGLVYLLGDRLNYEVGNSPTPSQVNFLWPQYDLLYRRLSAQSGQFKKEQDGVDGRERYEAINDGKEAKP